MFKLWRTPKPEKELEPTEFVERRGAPRVSMFQYAVVTIEAYFQVQVIITDLSETGARIAFAARVELPSRVGISAPTLKLKCWARVVWQGDGAAGLEFLAAA